MKDDIPVDVVDEENIPDLPVHAFVFDGILEKYGGIEPIVNWASEDLIKLQHAIALELGSR